MFFVLSKILDVLLSPYSWALVLLVLAVPWRTPSAACSARKRRFGVASLVLLTACSALPVSNAMALRLEHSLKSTYRENVTYDAVVLLGGVLDEEATTVSGQPSYNDNVERVVMVHKLLHDGKARVVIVSTAPSNPNAPELGEARVVARQLEAWGIEPSRIVLEERARNTRENAVYTQQIVNARGYKRVLIVTSAFHMVRAAECFSAVDMPVDTFAVDYRAHEHVEGWTSWIPRASSLASSVGTMREIAGRIIYRAQGYAKAVPPS